MINRSKAFQSLYEWLTGSSKTSTNRRIEFSGDRYGPIDGFCKWAGKRYWFEYQQFNEGKLGKASDDSEATYESRAYFLFEISDEHWEYLEEMHKLFRECIGTHWDYEYDENGERIKTIFQHTGREQEFYSKYPPGKQYKITNAKLVAYVDASYISSF